MNWPNFFLGIFYAFLPKAYWRSWRPSSSVDFVRSALVSGLLQFAAFAYLLIRGYLRFIVIRTHELQAASVANESTQLYFLALLTIEYAFHPLTLIFIIFAVEGALRSSAAFLTNEVIPSFPVRLVALFQDWREARKRKASLGPDIPDSFERVQGEAYDLRISAQKPKGGWRISLTVAVEDEFYEIARVETDTGSRPFLYFLRKLPPGAMIRGFYRYDPPDLRQGQ